MTYLNSLNNFLAVIRPLLETIFFIASIALAGFAYKGLEQLRIAKDTNRVNARREAYKLAAEECRNFAERVIPLTESLRQAVAAQKITVFSNHIFKLANGEFLHQNFNDDNVRDAFIKLGATATDFMNSVEGFAIFFASGIAEEPIGYREAGRSFCLAVRTFMPAFYFMRSHGFADYESTIKLYELWNAKLESEELTKKEKSLTASLSQIRARNTSKPLDIPTVGDH